MLLGASRIIHNLLTFMSSCNQSAGAELDEEYDENDPPTVTTIEQVSVLLGTGNVDRGAWSEHL